MKIEIKSKKTPKMFCNVTVGDVFVYEGKPYLKTGESSARGFNPSASFITSFRPDKEIQPVSRLEIYLED